MEEKLKWIMVTNYVHNALLNNEDCLRTGLYAWVPVFDGDVKHWTDMVDKNELKKYDIVHINLSGQDVHLVANVREVLGNGSKTKIVANNDYTVELWQKSFEHMDMLRREVSCADMVFGTEPNQVGTMEVLLGRKVHLIVHPCFTRRLKTLRPKRTLNTISVIHHRYDNYTVVPSLAVGGLGYKTRLIGYDNKHDSERFATMTRYNDVLLAENYMTFCEQLQESLVVVDPFTLTSQSRTGWDCAALGVPMVGSDRNYSVQKCFPFTMCSPYNMKQMREMVKKVLNDKQFREKVINYAKDAVEYVSYENSKKKYLDALKEGSPKITI